MKQTLGNKDMKQMNFKKKLKGFAISSELIFLSTIVTAGLTVGMVNVRDAVVAEMSDVGDAIGALDQTYAFKGIVNGQTSAEVAGSGYIDAVDTVAGDLAEWRFIVPTGTEAGSTLVTGGVAGGDQGTAPPPS
jgi:hypothetical protein